MSVSMPAIHSTHHQRHPTPWAPDVGVYLLWGLCGVLDLITLAGILSIGLLVLPIAVVACALAAYLTFGRAFRPQCMAGLMLPLGIGIGWLGSWFTYASSDPGDHCYRIKGGVECDSSFSTDASGHSIETTPHHAGELPTGFQWSHTWPSIAVGATVVLLSVVVFIIAGLAVRRNAVP